jgi:omega-amidase
MHVHLVQLDSVWEDPRASFASVERLLAANPPEPGALVILPEMFATGFSLDLSKTCGEASKETEGFALGLAKKYDSTVLAGVISPGAKGRARNEAVVFSPGGELLARYLKQRPFSGGGEDLVHEKGWETAIFSWADLKVAPLICYDLRFPELFREGLRAGAEMFVVIAAWPETRIEHWLTLLRARAIENQAYVIGVNGTGQEPQHRYSGRSIVVDPHGRVLADAGESEGVLAVSIDPEVVRTWRAEFPAVRDFARWSA